MKINIVELNNKSRKGVYIYIKDKNLAGKYYKFKNNRTIDAYAKYYHDRYVKKKVKGSLNEYIVAYENRAKGIKPKKRSGVVRQAEQYLKKIKGRTISDAFKKGLSYSVIKDVKTVNNNVIKSAYMKLFKDIVLDPQLLSLIVTDENIKKIANRLEYRLSFKDKNGKELANCNKFGVSLRQIKSEIGKAVKKGEAIDEAQASRTPKFARKLKEVYNYKNVNVIRNGVISRTELTIIFRKG